MTLYFKIGYQSWIQINNCYDYDHAVNSLKCLWDLKDLECINENDFKSHKNETVAFIFNL